MEINIGSIVKIKKGHQDNRGYDDFFKERDKYEHLFIVTRMSIYDDIRIITREDLIKHVENMQKRWINESIQ